jgi:SAM-dependent methyltransferase
METVQRFSNRVENYVKYRPGYPTAVLDLFKAEMGLKVTSVVADIGSGTGISSRMFLENGNTVYGIEPNPVMRAAAEKYLSAYPNFRSVDGTAEETGLEAASVDLIVAAQAFHWFQGEKTRKEFERVLRPGGYISLIWNERQLDSTAFLVEYEEFLLKYGKDYREVRHENVTPAAIGELFQRRFNQRTFDNAQVLDFDGLRGRMLSASYMPAESDAGFDGMIAELRSLFDKHAEHGKIKLLYNTNIFYSQL